MTANDEDWIVDSQQLAVLLFNALRVYNIDSIFALKARLDGYNMPIVLGRIADKFYGKELRLSCDGQDYYLQFHQCYMFSTVALGTKRQISGERMGHVLRCIEAHVHAAINDTRDLLPDIFPLSSELPAMEKQD